MENVILAIHLLLAFGLIVVVLLQRSEGGALGMGGGGGGGMMTGRGVATALSKLTWLLAVGFIATSLTLTILATANSDGGSVIDGGGAIPAGDGPALPPGLNGNSLLPPSPEDGPALPPAE